MGKHLNDYPRGAAARLPHHLALQDHQALGQQLREAEAVLTALADVLVEAYGKSAEATRYAVKLMDTCGVLRGHLARHGVQVRSKATYSERLVTTRLDQGRVAGHTQFWLMATTPAGVTDEAEAEAGEA